MKGVTQELRAIKTQSLRPALNLSGFCLGDSKAQHRHTKSMARMTDGLKEKLWVLATARYY